MAGLDQLAMLSRAAGEQRVASEDFREKAGGLGGHVQDDEDCGLNSLRQTSDDLAKGANAAGGRAHHDEPKRFIIIA